MAAWAGLWKGSQAQKGFCVRDTSQLIKCPRKPALQSAKSPQDFPSGPHLDLVFAEAEEMSSWAVSIPGMR